MKTTRTLIAAAVMAASMPAMALEDGKLTIWMGENKGNEQLAAVVAKFEADLGLPVSVEVVDPLTDKFQQAAATGDGPDIVLWAHDRCRWSILLCIGTEPKHHPSCVGTWVEHTWG